jgi:putative SOS response-associated peptidase YedK
MCARYAITSPAAAIRALFGYREQADLPARYNVAPTQPIPVVRLIDGRRSLALMRWGFIPAWVRDPRKFSLLINARGETALDKPAFRNAMRRRRCLIPADGFYDWQSTAPKRRPFFVRARSPGPIALAGLWETWIGPNGEEVDSAVVVTTQANRALSAIHDRMPVVVAPEAFDLWLDCDRVDAVTAAALIAPAPEGLLECYEVSPLVNNVANDDARLVEPAPNANADRSAMAPAPAAGGRKNDDDQPSLF